MLGETESFLWEIRHYLHRLTKRDENRLLFDYQRDIAAMFGYQREEGRSPNYPIEQFMKRYYRSAQQVSTLNEMLLAYFNESVIAPRLPDYERKIEEINANFKLVDGKLAVQHHKVFSENPSAILEIFYLLANRPEIEGIRARTLRLLTLAAKRIDQSYRNNPIHQALFMAIIRSPYRLYDTMVTMKRYGVLGNYIPAFGQIMGLMQYDLFHIYTVDADAKRYYQASNTDKLKGCESVTISVTCSDDSELGKGTTQYKCGDCGKELNAHSKECAMLTTTAESSLDLSGLDEREREAREKIASLEAQISALQSENVRIASEIGSASIEEAAELRNRYNANQTEIGQLQSELAQWQGTLADILAAKEEAASDNDVATDDHYRIPAIMRDCQTVYDIRWQDKGAWNGFTFTRKGIVGGINGMVTFTARLTMARKPKYFLGIKIHRAILQIDWKLTAHYSTTNIVEVLTLDPAKSEQEKLDEVNGRIS